MKEIYDQIVFWKTNVFTIPTGRVGKLFISEMSGLIDSWCNKDTNHQASFVALMVMPTLLLQKPVGKPQAKDIKEHLESRLGLWKENKFGELFRECQTIQKRLKEST